MDVFNALWDNPEQRKRPPDDNFQLFTMEEWLAMASTHKILSGTLKCPLPPELEPPDQSASQGNWAPKFPENQKTRNKSCQDPQGMPGVQKAHQSNNLKADGEKKAYIPGLTKFPTLGRISCLTSIEQRDCLSLFLKFYGKSIGDLTPTEKAEYQLFQSLYSRVKEEQKEFLEQAKLDWSEYVDRTCKLNGDPRNFYIQCWANKVTRTMAAYAKQYRKLRIVTFSGKTAINTQLHFIRNLLNIGKIPILKLPQFDAPFRISTSMIRLRTWGLLNVPPAQLSGTLHKVPVSRDPNAERLARLHGANVVISTSGLRCLLDNHNEKKHPPCSGVGRSWALPVIVKEHHSFCNGKPVTKTIVFIDKPIPPAKVTSFQKVSWYQKHALFAAIVHRHHKLGIEFEIKGKDIFIARTSAEAAPQHFTQAAETPSKAPETAERRNDQAAHIVSVIPEIPKLAVSEQGHIVSPEIPKLAVSEQGNSTKTSEELSSVTKLVSDASYTPVSPASTSNFSDDEDENTLTIDLPDEEPIFRSEPPLRIEKTPLELPEKSSSSMERTETSNSESLCENIPRDNIIVSINEDTEERKESMEKPVGPADSKTASYTTRKWENVPSPPQVEIVNGNALPVCHSNVTYNLWSLQSQVDRSVINSTLPKLGSLNLLIRSQVDGCEKLDSGAYQTFSIASKPEYQLEYGAGFVSLSDLTRQWAKLLIQPDSCLARIRVNVQSTELVKLEKRTMAEVQHEAQIVYKENLTDTLNILQEALSDLMQLPQGEYLLSHSPQMGSAAELYQKTEGGETAELNLASDYGALPGDIGSDVPWQPIDPTVILPRHHFFRCMPCTFFSQRGPAIVAKPCTRKPQPAKQITVNKAQSKKKKKKKNKKPVSAPSNEDAD